MEQRQEHAATVLSIFPHSVYTYKRLICGSVGGIGHCWHRCRRSSIRCWRGNTPPSTWQAEVTRFRRCLHFLALVTATIPPNCVQSHTGRLVANTAHSSIVLEFVVPSKESDRSREAVLQWQSKHTIACNFTAERWPRAYTADISRG